MGSEHKEVQEAASNWDAGKGEKGDSGSDVAKAGHDARNDMQDEAAQGDKFSQNLTTASQSLGNPERKHSLHF